MNRDLTRFNALRNALYHTSRRLTYDRWNRWFNFVIILLGAAGMADLIRLTDVSYAQVLIGAGVAAAGAAQLVFDFSGKARDHQALQRDYFHLLAEIEENLNPSEDQIARWQAKMTRIAGDEPPVYRALDAKAYNDAIGATEIFVQGERLHIPVIHRLFGSLWAFEGYDYKKLCELPGYKQIET